MKRVLLLGVLLGCGARQTPANEAAQAHPLTPSRWEAKRNTDTPVIALRVVFEAGSADDPPALPGLTHLTALTMLEGRAGELGYAERERLLFPMAAHISLHVEREQTVFSARVHKDHLAAFYPLFRDVLRAPAFDAGDIERLRARALSHLTQDLRGADDEALGKELLQAMLFQGHPYAHPELGSESGLRKLDRAQMIAQRARVFCAARVRAAVSGPIDEAFAKEMERDLAALDSPSCEAKRPLPPPSTLQTRRVWIVDKPEAASVAISFGLPIDVSRSHPDYPALTLAAAYLGQHRTFAGKLMQKMRGDRGLNYGDYAYAENFVQEGDSRFPMPNVARRQQYFSIWLRPVRPEQTHFALRMAVRELELVVEQGIGEADFARIQQFVSNYYALFAQTEQQRLGYDLDAGFYGEGTARDVAQLRAQLAQLTREQVNAAIKRHIVPGRIQVAMVAPNANALADKLVLGERSPITYNVDKPAALLEEDKQIEKHALGLTREQVNVLPLETLFR
ncbi:MAG TPA: pitrilysin family protein [Polyangiales bacterium]